MEGTDYVGSEFVVFENFNLCRIVHSQNVEIELSEIIPLMFRLRNAEI